MARCHRTSVLVLASAWAMAAGQTCDPAGDYGGIGESGTEGLCLTSPTHGTGVADAIGCMCDDTVAADFGDCPTGNFVANRCQGGSDRACCIGHPRAQCDAIVTSAYRRILCREPDAAGQQSHGDNCATAAAAPQQTAWDDFFRNTTEY